MVSSNDCLKFVPADFCLVRRYFQEQSQRVPVVVCNYVRTPLI